MQDEPGCDGGQAGRRPESVASSCRNPRRVTTRHGRPVYSETRSVVDWLVFIDTNIFLDFYRTQGTRQKGLSVLDHLKDNYDRFITSSQVEMEFKKNRQLVIIDAFKKIAKLVPKSKKVLPYPN